MLDIVSAIFNGTWDLLSVKYPGTSIPIGVIMVGALLITVSLRLIGYVINASFSVKGTANEIKGINKKIKTGKNKGDI